MACSSHRSVSTLRRIMKVCLVLPLLLFLPSLTVDTSLISGIVTRSTYDNDMSSSAENDRNGVATKGSQKVLRPKKVPVVDINSSRGADFIELKKGNNNYIKKKTKPGKKIAVVVSHYDEWLQSRSNDSLVMKPPDWARTDIEHSNYFVPNIYQKMNPNEPNFVPNHGFESGTYMKYIVDNYNRLPEVVVFTQADACGVKKIGEIMERLTVDMVQRVGGYLPLNCNKITKRTFSLWRGLKTPKDPNELSKGRRVEDCMRQVASDFGRGDIFDGIPYSTYGPGYDPDETKGFTMSFICCACFAVTRERIKQMKTHDNWIQFYNRTILNGECVPGRKDQRKGKSEIGGAMEHLVHVIFGGHEADWTDRVCLSSLLQLIDRKKISKQARTAGNDKLSKMVQKKARGIKTTQKDKVFRRLL